MADDLTGLPRSRAALEAPGTPTVIARRVVLRGAVQGVGMRPFLYRLAGELGVRGRVANGGEGVELEIEGAPAAIARFLARVPGEMPAQARLQRALVEDDRPRGRTDFRIVPAPRASSPSAWAIPDLAPCDACVRELFDPASRRYRYPFVSCAQCGPRFTIARGIPYERANTTLADFPLCPACEAEFASPADRRFHAETIGCEACGPRLSWHEPGKTDAPTGGAALARALALVRAGKIVAVKGIGGFHLVADARDDGAVTRLRSLKRREAKPFAVLFPSLVAIRAAAHVTAAEEALLASPAAPIVLVEARGDSGLAPSVAPGLPLVGAMLPSSPLHHLLAHDLGFPVVATSGNLSEEPICTENDDALARLSGIADGFLLHDRPIARRADDSVTRVVLGRTLVLRSARGLSPIAWESDEPWGDALAVGGQLKAAFALSRGTQILVGPHQGDLDDARASDEFARSLADFSRLHGAGPAVTVSDAHPDYVSTRLASARGSTPIAVQHHAAHVAACLVDNRAGLPALGVAWDGAGHGNDGTVWGGEFLMLSEDGIRRVARLRHLRLPGGDRAAREPRRMALALAAEMGLSLDAARLGLLPGDSDVLATMVRRGFHSPLTSSMGRLFDAVASLLGVCHVNRYEGEAAMRLEALAARAAGPGEPDDPPCRFTLAPENGVLVADWAPVVTRLLEGQARGVPLPRLARRFHVALAALVVAVARETRAEKVALTGGCFQNRALTELTVHALGRAGIPALWHRELPPNDGGLCVGQLALASRETKGRFPCA